MTWLSIVVALGAAGLFALSTSVQHQTATDAPTHVRGVAPLMRHLVGHPRWLAGQAISVVAFLLHATALKLGTLTVVQPVLVSGLVFTLPVRALMDRRRPTRAEILGALVTAIGLALFLVVARPRGGHASPERWWAAALLGVGAVLAAVCAVTAGRLGRTRLAGLLLGFAAGDLSGLAAGMLKLTTNEIGGGIASLLLSWPPYALLAAGLWGLTLNQRAYRSASLSVTLPVFNLVDPLAAMIFGIVVFGERPAHTPVAVVGEAIGLLVMAVGAVALGRHAPAAAPPPV